MACGRGQLMGAKRPWPGLWRRTAVASVRLAESAIWCVLQTNRAPFLVDGRQRHPGGRRRAWIHSSTAGGLGRAGLESLQRQLLWPAVCGWPERGQAIPAAAKSGGPGRLRLAASWPPQLARCCLGLGQGRVVWLAGASTTQWWSGAVLEGLMVMQWW